MIHPSALIASSAVLGSGVTVGPFTIVHEGVVIGDYSVIGSHCELGFKGDESHTLGTSIGAGSLLRSHSVIYDGASLGEGLSTGHHVSIRERTTTGDGVSLGSYSDLQGDCTIGRFSRLHSNVHVGKSTVIRDYVWVYPNVVFTNDPFPPSDINRGVTVDDFAVIATGVVLLPGVRVGNSAVVAAGTVVKTNVFEGYLYAGRPGKNIGPASTIQIDGKESGPAYPWQERYRHRFRLPDE
jgi:acyl-[acyl carrier protein]--UDP-N-acetylglucosamine O-acyltransferase